MIQIIAIASIVLTAIPAFVMDSCDICCGQGEFLNFTTSLCDECPANRYMDKTRHSYITCKPCTVYSREIHHVNKTSDCTRFNDTEIQLCDEGFYIENRPEESRCSFCPQCPNNMPGCCRKEDTEPNIGTTPSPAASVNNHSSLDPVSDFNLQVRSSYTSTRSPTTPTTEYLHCNTIRPEQCEHAHSLTHEKCFNGVQYISCTECPGCKTAIGSSSETSLSTKYVVMGLVPSLFLTVVVCIIIACCYLRNKKKTYVQANRNDYDDL